MLVGGLASRAFWIWTMMSSTAALTSAGDDFGSNLLESAFTFSLMGLKSLQYAWGLWGPLLPQAARAGPPPVGTVAAERSGRPGCPPSLAVESPSNWGPPDTSLPRAHPGDRPAGPPTR